MGTIPTMSLPASLVMENTMQDILGTCTIQDTGTNTFGGIAYRISSTTVGFYVGRVSATYSEYAQITATVPMTWTNTDKLVTNYYVQIA